MFEEKCRKCGGQFVHIINLKSYGNYRMCPDLYRVLQTSFKTDESRIYCGSPTQQSKIPPEKVKPDHCVFCNQKPVKMAQVVGMKHFEVCPDAFGMFLYAYKTEQRGITTKIYCEPKVEVEAKLTKPIEVTLNKGITNHHLAWATITNQASLTGVRMQIDVPVGWSYTVNPQRVDFQPPNSQSKFDICISIPQNTLSGVYLLRYKPVADKIGDRTIGVNELIKGFDKPIIVRITVQ